MKRPKLPKPKKIVRNPHARALGEGLFRKRVVKRLDEYRRKAKHLKPTSDEPID